MDVEKTIQFLLDNAAAHDAQLTALEKNSVLIQQALLHLAQSQKKLETTVVESQRSLQQSIQETQRALRELGEKTDERIASLVSAIAKLAERDANGRGRQ